MATLTRPALRRTAATQPIRASFFDDSNDARNSPQAQQLREQITTAYSNTGLKGPAFQLPSGAVVVEDMWAASLNTTIDEILDSGLDGLKVFADQDNDRGWVLGWLGHKIGLEGNDQQKHVYGVFRDYILRDRTPRPNSTGMALETPADYIRAGLPVNIMNIQHQPLQEVEVYRDLAGFEMPQEVEPCRDLGGFEMPEGEDDDENKAEDDDMAEGA